MADTELEQQVDNTQVETTQQAEQSTKQPSKYEQQALEQGWRPIEEWEGDPEDFVSAKEFVQRKSFFDKIGTQSKKIKELETSISQFREHHAKVEEMTRKRILDELKAKKKEALENGDPDAVVEIDEAIADFKIQDKEIRDREKQQQQQVAKNDPAPLMEWKQRNNWFEQDSEMTKYANRLAYGYRAEDPDRDPVDILQEIERDVKQRFPEKFKNQARQKAPVVEPSSNGKAAGGKPVGSKYSPTDEERKVAQRFVRSGFFKSENEYYESLAQLGKGEE